MEPCYYHKQCIHPLPKPRLSAIAIAIVDRKGSAYPGVQKSLAVLVENGILNVVIVNLCFVLTAFCSGNVFVGGTSLPQ